MKWLALIGGLLLWAGQAEAACTGSGITWTCTPGSTLASAQSAVNNGSDGMTITLQAGSYTWNSGTIELDATKATILQCIAATINNCIVTQGSNTVINMFYSASSIKKIRITGITWRNTAECGNGCFSTNGQNNARFSNFRVDHNWFQNYLGNPVVWQLGATDPGYTAEMYGVFDHNTITGTFEVLFCKVLGPGNPKLAAWVTTQSRGTTENLFFEDNTFTFTNNTGSINAMFDMWQGAGAVIRFNTFTNSRVAQHDTGHGGTRNFEVYGNKMIKTLGAGGYEDGTRNVHLQGSGEVYVFGERYTYAGSKSGEPIDTMHYRSAAIGEAGYDSVFARCDGLSSIDGNRTPRVPTYYGYPCWRQLGRGPTAIMLPMYAWDNSWTNDGTMAVVNINNNGWSGPPFGTTHLHFDRDIYQAVSTSVQSSAISPFSGTTGMGFGTLANRPTTCAVTTEPLDAGNGGVGYASTGGTWMLSTPSQGNTTMPAYILYRCFSTTPGFQWVLHYTPYTYPHPLAGGAAPPDTTAPAPPTGVTVQ